MTACQRCGAEFASPNPNRRTCSRSCAVALGWLGDTRDKRRASLSAAQKARGEEIAEQNRRRWAQPGEREAMSERNRRRWADPATRARLTEGIRARQSSPEMRRLYGEIRRRLWRDPEYRARASEAIRRSKGTPEARAMFSALLRERWQDPVWREKWMNTMSRLRAKAALAPEAPAVAPPSPAPAAPVSGERQAELDAIAAFLAQRPVTKLPPVGDPALLALPFLKWDRTKRLYVREGTGSGA